MRLGSILLVAVIAAFGIGAERAMAQNEQFIPRLVYRTGAYAPNGIPFADGYADYLDMVNARDGGVGGVKIKVEECETGYDTAKGVQCYESVKSKNPLVTTPYSTAITLQVIPKAYLQHAHHWLILHGRYVCRARKPSCDRCIVSDLCPSEDKWFYGTPPSVVAKQKINP